MISKTIKNILCLCILAVASIAQAQTFTVQNLNVLGTIQLSSPLAVAQGGSGLATLPQYNVLIGNGTGAISAIGPGAAGNVLMSNGATSFPSFQSLSGTYATLASPAFTGTPTAPTAALGTNTTQLATTAFVAVRDICRNILDYGGNNTNSTNNDTAWTNVIAAQASAAQQCVYFPAGNYKFAGLISENLASGGSLTIKGDGPNVTNLTWATGNGMQFDASGQRNSVHIRDLSLMTGTTSGGFALALVDNINGASPYPDEISDITNVSIHGSDGYAATNYWTQGILVNSWSNINFVNVNIYGGGGGGPISGYSGQGIGVQFSGGTGSGQPPIGVQYNITGCQINYLGTGIQYGANIQGITVSQSNFVGGTYGINVPSSETGTSQLTVTASQFNEGTYGISDNSGVPAVQIIGNYFLIPTPATSSVGVNMTDSYGTELIGNQFQRIGASATGTNGIVLGSTTGPGSIVTGNVFINLTTAVWFNSSSSKDTVQGNTYGGNGTNVLNQGTNNNIGVATQ